MRYYVTLTDREVAVDVERRPGGQLEVWVEGEPVEVDAVDAEGAVHVRVGGHGFDLWLEDDGSDLRYVAGGVRSRARVESERQRMADRASRGGARGGGVVTAPMPGRVVKLLVREGEVVDAGTPVVVVEAMKMENELLSDNPGVVTTIHAGEGAQIEGGAALVELGPLPE